MKKDDFLFLDVLGQADDTFIEASSQPWQKADTSILKIREQNLRRGLWHIKHRWHVAAVILLLATMSVAAFASDDIREGLRQLRLQFFSDNVTIDTVQENVSEQADSHQTDFGENQKGKASDKAFGDTRENETADESFQAYKWKEIPEGYQVVYEDVDDVFQQYCISLENSHGSYIEYSQTDVENSQHHISYDSQKGYKRIIELTDELEAYSISDGRNNTIFYEEDGYLFEFMSDQPEETIEKFIDLSGVLELGE